MSMGLTESLLPRSTSPVVSAVDIAHIRIGRPDLNKAVDFYSDFGLTRSLRSAAGAYFFSEAPYGPTVMVRESSKPEFYGLGLMVASVSDLEALSKLPGASDIEVAEGWPDGKQVRLNDPAGNEVRALFGPKPDTPAVRDAMKMNLKAERERVNEMQRPPMRPSTILRLGHCVLNVVEFTQVARWYMDTFGMLPSDIQVLNDKTPALVFTRCNRGSEPADHHTVVIAQNVVNGLSHAAFEVIDMDDIAMGQEHMKSRGWKHAWGLGRHLLGSQLFDYWRDPWGDKFEHFCDSDLFTEDRPADVTELTMAGLYQWGPPVPHDFEAPKISPGFLVSAFKNIRNSDEMSFGRAIQMLKMSRAKPRDWGK